MSYEATVLADSVNGRGDRLITVQVTFPRFILAEMNTHRVFSRNSASSRAIPPENLIEQVRENPFVPETFNERIKGMGVGVGLAQEKQAACRRVWLSAANAARVGAELLLEQNVDKSRINRLLEPFMWHTAIISSTEWENFFALRTPVGEEATKDFPAQLEFQKIALEMRRVMRDSEPQPLSSGQWHLPLVSCTEIDAVGYEGEVLYDPFFWAKVSAGRCAKVSYLTHQKPEDARASYTRAGGLEKNGHLSPFEHVAQPSLGFGEEDTGNFVGWKQLRKHIVNESNLVGSLEGRGPWHVRPGT